MKCSDIYESVKKKKTKKIDDQSILLLFGLDLIASKSVSANLCLFLCYVRFFPRIWLGLLYQLLLSGLKSIRRKLSGYCFSLTRRNHIDDWKELCMRRDYQAMEYYSITGRYPEAPSYYIERKKTF